MGKIKKIIIVVGLMVILGFIIWLALMDSKKNKEQILEISPTPSQSEIDDGYAQEIDGATEITVSEQEQKIIDEMSKLRDMLPLKNDQFSLYFSYDTNKFIIFYKNNETNNFDILKDWLVSNGMKDIPMEDFVIGGSQAAKNNSSTYSLNYLLPYEEDDFIVIKYIKDKVLLVHNKNSDLIKTKESLRKWLDLVETKKGENIIVWQ
jgi:hypothetical protein